MTENTCATFTESRNSIQLLPCTDTSQFCNAAESLENPWKNVTCGPPPVAEKYPGDKCGKSSECLSQDCSSGTCVGTKIDGDCKLNEDCDLGLYCGLVNNTCVPLETTGDCFIDYDCGLTSGCNLTAEVRGTCVPYFSLADGESVACSGSGLNLLCSSGFCNNTHSHLGFCTTAPQSVGQFPTQCGTDEDCTDKTGEFHSKCVCGLNPFGIQYCLPMVGDPQGQAYLAAMKTVLTHTNLGEVCQTTRRFSDDCWQNLARADSLFDPDKTYVAAYNYTNYADYINNKDCVKATLTATFWDKASK